MVAAVSLAGLLGAPSIEAQATASPHGTLPPGLECTTCHTTEGWTPVRRDMAFDHGSTDFPLEGMHATVPCASCHLDDRFDEPKADAAECQTCHLDVHLDAFAQPCVACHTTDSFHDLPTFEVHARTTFPLTGAHLQVSCESCHQNEQRGPFSQVDGDCITCHQEAYVTAPEIDHDLLGFPEDCTQCHNTLAWASTPQFQHDLFANGFQLLGAHEPAPCTGCHIVPGFQTYHSPMDQDDCIACHTVEFNSEHGNEGYPTTCLLCHTNQNWSGQFDHAASGNGFELLGAHQRALCTSCHTLPDLGTLFMPSDATDCITCHQVDYDREHAGSGFSTSCLDCHTTETWQGPDFDHVAASGGFDLVGAHTSLLCSSCHLPGNNDIRWAPPPASQNDCVACHQDDYDLEHGGTGFSTNCTDCHDAAGTTWAGATFDHAAAAGGFRLLAPHDQAPCSACHVQPGNALLFSPANDQDCIACHQSEYNFAHNNDPFPTTCLDCHAPTTWAGATFDHSAYFPIYSGAHKQSVWGQCSTCHNDPQDSSVFTCLVCHEHRQSAMDEKHREESGYVYESNACYSCHTNGRS